MASIPLAALNVRPPEAPPNQISQLGQAVQLKSMLQAQPYQQQQLQQQVQAGAQENQMRQQQIQDQQATTAAMKAWNGKDLNELPSLMLKNGGSATAVFGMKNQILQQKTALTKLDSDTLANQETKNNALLGKLQSVTSGDDAGLSQRLLQTTQEAVQGGLLDPQHAQTVQQMVQQTQDPKALRDQLSLFEKSLQGQKEQFAQAQGERKTAAEELAANARMKAAGKGPEGEMPLPNTDQMNQALASRFQVLNPGKPLPPQFTLPANATQKDYDRIDKAMESTEKATGTKAQLDTANAIREQTKADAEEKQGQSPVTGTDASGRDVLVSAADAKNMKLTGVMKADADIVNKSTAARHWLPLAEKTVPMQLSDPNDPKSPAKNADQMGILQLIDHLDQRGELGPVASRWNEFMAGKVGSGDPEITALRAKMGLSNTKLMQAHVGSRGGAFMLEHFEDLANAKKMDADTLRTGVKSELDYMRDVAMQPGKPGKSGTTPSTTSHPFFDQFGGTARPQ